jgi:hypothetical protein
MSSSSTSQPQKTRSRQRSRRRRLCCPAHPEQQLAGGDKRYFLHLLTAEELTDRCMPSKKARLVISSYSVLTLSDGWLEELFCPECGMSRWCHVVRHNRVKDTERWAPRELWEKVAHVEPLTANPSVSEFSRRAAHLANSQRRYQER